MYKILVGLNVINNQLKMINFHVFEKKFIFTKSKQLKIFKNNFVFTQLFFKRVCNRIIFAMFSLTKRFTKNFLKFILNSLYRLRLNFIAKKLLRLYRLLRKKDQISFPLEYKTFNNTRINRLDYHFNYSISAQEIFNDLKLIVINSKGNNR